ncbi:hypothetical protein N9P99_00265 [Planktomarina temperata]|nr:hypothetical protein [Planktomarina temperata]
MISGLVLKYLNGECFVIRRGYETARPVSSSFCLTVPARNLGTDPSVINPSRIMRIAGTVSYPSQSKVTKGYIPELVTFISEVN